jgi:hypothetical protein
MVNQPFADTKSRPLHGIGQSGCRLAAPAAIDRDYLYLSLAMEMKINIIGALSA